MSRSTAVLVVALGAIAGLATAIRLLDDAPASDASVAIDPARAAAGQPESATAPDLHAAPTATLPPAVTFPAGPTVLDGCLLSTALSPESTSPEVACLEHRLIAAGFLAGVEPDSVYDATTMAAVEAFQTAQGLVVDGLVGAQTASRLGAWVGPGGIPDASTCPQARAAVVDRANQRAWLCDGGAITRVMPVTTARSQPDPGSYEVYAKDMKSSSELTGRLSTMTHFVAFSYGENRGARIAFHSIPQYTDGTFVQPLDSVGNPDLHGDSSGCIRVLPDDAALIWDWLAVGDTVVVVS